MEKNILIVDDEPSIIKVLDLFLKKEGFNIDSASSISETYKKLKKKEYSMIFLDINLPDGKSLDYFDKIKSNSCFSQFLIDSSGYLNFQCFFLIESPIILIDLVN